MFNPAGNVFEDQGISYVIVYPETWISLKDFSCLLLLKNLVIYKETEEEENQNKLKKT